MYVWSLNVSAVNAWRLRMRVKIYFFFQETIPVSNKTTFRLNKKDIFFHRSLARGSHTSTSSASSCWSCLAGTGPCPSGGGSALAPPTTPDTTPWATGSSPRSPTTRATRRGATASSAPSRGSRTTRRFSCARSVLSRSTTTASRKAILCLWFYYFRVCFIVFEF